MLATLYAHYVVIHIIRRHQLKMEKIRLKKLEMEERQKEYLAIKERKYAEKIRRMKEEAQRKMMAEIQVGAFRLNLPSNSITMRMCKGHMDKAFVWGGLTGPPD